MKPRELQVGEIVQINPAIGGHFAGCLMVVTDSKSWGAQGYVQDTGHSGQAYYRCNFEDMELTGGMAPWTLA